MKIEKYVTIFEALAQASRLKIFRLLVKSGGRTVFVRVSWRNV